MERYELTYVLQHSGGGDYVPLSEIFTVKELGVFLLQNEDILLLLELKRV